MPVSPGLVDLQINGFAGVVAPIDDLAQEPVVPRLGAPQHLQIGGKPRDGGLRESGKLALPLVPPIRQGPLRIDVDQHHRPRPCELRLYCQVAGQGSLARSALLRCHRKNAHEPLSPL